MSGLYWSGLGNHLWQSTIFAGVIWLVTLALRTNRAQVRHRLWLAASIKFLVPFSLLVSGASYFHWQPGAVTAVSLPPVIERLNQPFELIPTPIPSVTHAPSPVTMLVISLWLLGGALVLMKWCVSWRRIRAAVRMAKPLPLDAPIPVLCSPSLLEPGVFGIFRPVLLLPEGIVNRLTPAQLDAILQHEMCHVRRRDNHLAALHMVVEAIFWFHPLVWWIGAQMVAEREQACDEEVLRLGAQRETYAEGILNVCKHYLESPLSCAAGVTGADLRQRIEAIMTARLSARLGAGRKLLLATVGVVALVGPIFIGTFSARVRAQSKPDMLTFDVASIKPSSPDAVGSSMQFLPGGGLRAQNGRVLALIQFAYGVLPFEVTGGPGWLRSEGFDILAKPPQAQASGDFRTMNDAERDLFHDQMRERVRTLLAERFQLVVHRETREVPAYALVVTKNGPKFKQSTTGDGGNQNMRGQRGRLLGERVTMAMLASTLARNLGRPVLDRTALKGTYDFELQWTPDNPGPAGKGDAEEAVAPDAPSLFVALQEQLGLKLESTKGPAEIIVIDHVEKPSGN